MNVMMILALSKSYLKHGTSGWHDSLGLCSSNYSYEPLHIDSHQYNRSNCVDDFSPAARKTNVALWVSKSFPPSGEDFISEVRIVALVKVL